MSPLPRAIGPYEIVRPLGSGGMGAVYLALDRRLERHVAIKILHTTLDSPENRHRLLREARLAASLKHRNIVTIYAVDDLEGLPYIVMEYVVGETLAALIHARTPMGVVRRLDLIDEVCSGLVYAWKRVGIVHRDIKPSNLMVDREDVARILDFGIARAAQAGAITGTQVAGTPAYMAPEQIENAPVDHRCDVFSVGVVMYELLTYRRAFQGDTHAAVFQQVLRHEPVPMVEHNPFIEPDLERIVRRAICKAPSDRYQDLQQLRDDLAPIRERLSKGEAPDTTGFPDLTTTVPMPSSIPVFDRAAIDVTGAEPMAHGVVVPAIGTSAEPLLVSKALQPDAVAPAHQRAPGWIEQARRHFDAGELELARDLVHQAELRGGRTEAGEALRRDIERALGARPSRQAGAGGSPDARGVDVHINPMVSAAPAGLELALSPSVDADYRETPSTTRSFPPAALAGVALAVAASVLVGWWAMGGSRQTTRSQPATPTHPTAVPTAGPLPLRVETQPAGATVRMTGAGGEWTTPADVPIPAPYTPELRITAKGYDALSRTLTESEVRAGRLSVSLTASVAQPIAVVLTGPFPFEVVAGGRVVSPSRASHRFTVAAAGPLVLRAPGVFLERTLSVSTAPGGTFEYREPSPGTLTVRTTPLLERCRVSVNGREFDDPPYPPIVDKPVASGPHVVVLSCPDGERRAQSVTVGPGRAEIVTLR